MARKEERSGDLKELRQVGKRVRLARQARGLTLDQASEAADTSIQFLSQIEKGEQAMTMLKLGRLAKALGVSTDYLLFGCPPLDGRAALAVDYLCAMKPIEREILAQTVIGLRGLLDATEIEDG